MPRRKPASDIAYEGHLLPPRDPAKIRSKEEAIRIYRQRATQEGTQIFHPQDDVVHTEDDHHKGNRSEPEDDTSEWLQDQD